MMMMMMNRRLARSRPNPVKTRMDSSITFRWCVNRKCRSRTHNIYWILAAKRLD